jgi:chemotaxis protein CheX
MSGDPMSGDPMSTVDTGDVAVVPTGADLQEIADQVWSSYLDPECLDPLLPADPADDRFDALSSVSITGSWRGQVVFACTEKAARAATARFMGMDPAEVRVEDIVDVLGELANIVGGNVKGMLPAGCLVSMPHVVIGPGVDTHWPGVVRVANLASEWQGESVTFSLWQEQGRAARQISRSGGGASAPASDR